MKRSSRASSERAHLKLLLSGIKILFIFVEFFNQIMEFTREFSHRPLFKIWLGPVPFLVLFHSETIEVI